MRNLLIFFLLFSNLTFSQHNLESWEHWKNEMQEFYLNPETSPLKKDELSVFKGIQFYSYKDEFVIETKVEYLENQLPFEVATTGDKIQKYLRVAILHFEIASNKYQLELYQNVQLRENEKYKDYYFLPFLDNTNGVSTSSVGRYIDVSFSGKPEKIIIDFNKAYHPYCAYTDGYSCPITPFQNLLNVAITAGVKY